MNYTKNTRAWYLRTKYGDTYYIHTDGAIERADGACKPSGQWLFTALVDANTGRTVATLAGLENWYRTNTNPDRDAMLYKNGNPRYTVRDLDHGTARVWGNTKWHGIADLRPL